MDGMVVTGHWTEIGQVVDIPRQGARVVASRIGDIAVFRALDDTVFATLDRCPHKGGPLSQGIVHGHAVTCPLHNWVIDLRSGEAAAPDVGCVRRIPVRVEDGRILLSLPA
ncbi:MAG: nitrite reductase small subunit NirD [Paracraurococcus sp.]|jgi:nitrite reductase (NADH) small subunit